MPEPKTQVSIIPNLIEIDVDVDDVLRELSAEDIEAALQRRMRQQHGSGACTRLHLIYEEFVRRGDAPQVLKDYIYDMLGRIL